MSKFHVFALVAVFVALLFASVAHAQNCNAANCATCLEGNPVLCAADGCNSYYFNFGGTCTACPSHCQSCTSSTVCNTGGCDSGYQLKFGLCAAITVPDASVSLYTYGAVASTLATLFFYAVV